MKTGNAYSDSLDLGLTWTTNGLFSAARTTANVAVMHLSGPSITGKYVGDFQSVNNIEADEGWYLYESWVELQYGAGATSLRAGVMDLSAEFDTPVTSGLFTGSPFGIGTEISQSGERGPNIWPTTGLGVRAYGEFTPGLHWRVAAYDGKPGSDRGRFTDTTVSRGDGALLIGELEHSSERIHKLSVGAWSYTSRFERIDAELNPAPRARGNHGAYALIDVRVATAGTADIDAALRAGTARGRFNTFDRYVGAAVTASHLWDSRPDDALGLGIAHARSGAPYRALRNFQGQPATAGETTVELVYRAPLTDWLCVLPLVQYVRDPGMDPAVGNSWIAGLRFEVTREKSWPLSARHDSPTDDSYARTQP